MTIAMRTKSRQAAPSLSKQRLRLWIRILRAARAIEAEVRERLRVEFGVTLPQFDVMAALERKPDGMTMTELSRFLMVSNGNVTGIIDRLVSDKLVARQAGKAALAAATAASTSSTDAKSTCRAIRPVAGS